MEVTMPSEATTTVEVPGYHGRAVRVAAGARIRVTDVEGAQIGDMFAISASDRFEYLSPAQTRNFVRRLFPSVGDPFHTNRHRPILTFLEDHSPGPHDMLFAPCDQKMYEEVGFSGPHRSCRSNFLEATHEIGLEMDVVPDPVNLFQNTPAQADGSLALYETRSKAGDSVTFRAEMDLVFVLTACSADVGEINVNGGTSTPLRIEVFA
jgi:uncharacterized protein YcgI (DUF1989 family)